MRRFVGTATGLGLGVLGGLAGVAAYAARTLSGPTRRNFLDSYTISPFELEIPYEQVCFRSAEGLELRGWWLPRSGSSRTIIGCPGHRGGKHELIGIGSGLWRAGNSLLLFDFRGRGESQIGRCSLAHHEVADLLGALAYVRQRTPAAEIGVIGYSMGAAVAILAAARAPELGAVVADSSFATMRDVVAYNLRRKRLPDRVVISLADRLTRRWYGYCFDEVRPVDAIARLAPRPVLLIHGQRDSLTPVEHTHRLYAAAGEPKELWVTPGDEHCGSYFADRRAYIERVARFFERALPGGQVQAGPSQRHP